LSDISLVKIRAIAGTLANFTKKEPVLLLALVAALASALFVHPSAAYIGYIDFKVLACLFCLMAVVAGLRGTGLFDIAASALTRHAGTVRRMALVLVMATFFISMGITNDVALITFVPFGLLLMKDIPNPKTRMTILTLQTIAANLGSCLTPVGNPQNLYLFSFYELSAGEFFSAIAPVTIAGGILLILSVLTLEDEPVRPAEGGANHRIDMPRTSLYLVLFVLSVLAVFRILDYRMVTALVLILLVLFARQLLVHIDYSLLFTFVGFFVFMGNLQEIDQVNRFLTSVVNANVLLVSTIASQAISNVPAAVLLSHFTSDSGELLRGVSIGGLGTIIASLASVISFKFFVRDRPGETLGYLGTFTLWNSGFLVVLYILCILLH